MYAETWKSISVMVQRSERWCRYMAKQAARPLPVYKVGGIVRLDESDFHRWIGEQKRASAYETAVIMAA